MCGIAGLINLKGIQGGDLLAMSKTIRHRGPDDEGFFVSAPFSEGISLKGPDTISECSTLNDITHYPFHPSQTLGFVHRRLSILDLSSAGHQPMSYHEQAYTLVFNGEIYNYKELRAELQQQGYEFHSDTDTEVILASYQCYGERCTDKFMGMWAFALYDRVKNHLLISRDRFGIKPLYYFLNSECFAFASEIKALLALDMVKPEADMTAVLEYISFGATSDPSANLFKHIHVLPPSHQLSVSVETLNLTLHRYYDLEKQVRYYTLPSEDKIQHTFQALLDQSIDLHLRADVPIGSTLSGGLDSSTIVGFAASKMNGGSFKTYTAAYHEKDIDESDFARKVIAGYPNIDAHFTYPNIKQYWQDLEKMIWHQDLPINSTSMFAQWEVMKLAGANHTKVLLDGQGADEILGGYYHFAGIYLIEKLKRFQISSFIREKKELTLKFSPNMRNTLGRAFYYYIPEFLQRRIRAKKRIGMGFVSKMHQSKLENIHVPARGGRSYQEQSLLSTQFGLQDLLRYEDRNSMAFSIESRVPFLDHRLVEFCMALDSHWKIKNGWTKYILRKTAEPFLDKDVVWRKYKMGFLTPQKVWKEQSEKEIEQFLNTVTIPDFLDKQYLLNLNAANVNDSAHLSEFWKLVSFLKWAEIFKVTFN